MSSQSQIPRSRPQGIKFKAQLTVLHKYTRREVKTASLRVFFILVKAADKCAGYRSADATATVCAISSPAAYAVTRILPSPVIRIAASAFPRNR